MSISYDQIRGAVQALALEREEWAGYPMPIRDHPLRLNPRQPMAEMLQGAHFDADDQIQTFRNRACSIDDVREDAPLIRNQWFSHHHQAEVMIVQQGATLRAYMQTTLHTRNKFTINTLGVAASYAWDLEAEFTAQEKLAELITPHAFKCYQFTGGFLEESPRSGVHYLFRRLRPTLAIKATKSGTDTKILAALCLHPIGFYEQTWAGVMVPTDDVLAHLLLMRGDEHGFWRQANQHPAWHAAAGI